MLTTPRDSGYTWINPPASPSEGVPQDTHAYLLKHTDEFHYDHSAQHVAMAPCRVLRGKAGFLLRYVRSYLRPRQIRLRRSVRT